MTNSSSKQVVDHAKFNADGFLVFAQFADKASIASLIAELQSLAPSDLSDRSHRGVVFARRNLLSERLVQDILALPAIESLRQSISEDSIPVRAILFDKIGDANWAVPWHQDRSIMVDRRAEVTGFGPWSVKAGVIHVQPPVEILLKMFTFRLHLDSCDLNNGPLRVIPGTQHRILSPADIENTVSTARVAECVTDPGGLVVMRPLIVHSSLPAKVPRGRRVIHIEFGPRQLPPPLKWAAEVPSLPAV